VLAEALSTFAVQSVFPVFGSTNTERAELAVTSRDAGIEAVFMSLPFVLLDAAGAGDRSRHRNSSKQTAVAENGNEQRTQKDFMDFSFSRFYPTLYTRECSDPFMGSCGPD
jgi:hypothetical protein